MHNFVLAVWKRVHFVKQNYCGKQVKYIVWDILRGKLVKVVCKVFSGTNIVVRELMRGKMMAFRT